MSRLIDMEPNVVAERMLMLDRESTQRMLTRALDNLRQYAHDTTLKLSVGRTLYTTDGSNLAAYAAEVAQLITALTVMDKQIARAREAAYEVAMGGVA